MYFFIWFSRDRGREERDLTHWVITQSFLWEMGTRSRSLMDSGNPLLLLPKVLGPRKLETAVRPDIKPGISMWSTKTIFQCLFILIYLKGRVREKALPSSGSLPKYLQQPVLGLVTPRGLYNETQESHTLD